MEFAVEGRERDVWLGWGGIMEEVGVDIVAEVASGPVRAGYRDGDVPLDLSGR